VDLAKKYGDHESGKFVNGILDKIHKEEIVQEKSGGQGSGESEKTGNPKEMQWEA